MTSEKLPKRTKYLWQLRSVCIYFVIIALCAYFYPYYKFLLFAGAIITAVCLVTVLWYIPCFMKSFRIIYSDESIIIKRGVIIKTTHIMPYSRLIYTQTFTTPIAKLLKLTAISLKAARSTVVIPEMWLDDAKQFIESLSQGGEE